MRITIAIVAAALCATALGQTLPSGTAVSPEEAAAIKKAMLERAEWQRSFQATSEQREKFDSLLQEYDRKYKQGFTDDANGLIPEIIATYTPSPFQIDDGHEFRGQAGIDRLSQFTDELLRRNQKEAAWKIIRAFPHVSPAEVARLFPSETAPDEEHTRFLDEVWKLADRNDYWIWVHFRYCQQSARGRAFATPADVLLFSMEDTVRRNPGDYRAARRYAVAFAASRAHRTMTNPPAVDKPANCDWMGDVCRPVNASEYLTLASVVLSTNSAEGAVRLLRAGLKAPLTKADAEYAKNIRVNTSVAWPHTESTDEQIIHGRMMSELRRCLKLAGHADEAAAMMAENKVTPSGAEAGRLDAGKTNPVFEKAILDAAATKGDTPQYWMDRAEYYAKRGDSGSAEAAYIEAMSRAKPEGTAGVVTKSWVLARYIYFIAYDKRDPKAGYEKLWEQSKGFPSERICRLIFDYRPAMEKDEFATGDDSRLWKVLQDTPTWTIVQMRIVQKMINHPGGWREDQVIEGAIGLARRADTTRAAAVADALLMGAGQAAWAKHDGEATKLYGRAAEVLEEAVPRAKAGARGADYLSDPQWLKYSLLKAYRELAAWDKILKLYPESESAPKDYPNRELAIAAAMAGDKGLALRHWERSLSVRPDQQSVAAMAKAGCREELISVARKALEAAPGNEGAKDVLTWLGEPTTQAK